jgi:RND family efflux transporter MFP subunit
MRKVMCMMRSAAILSCSLLAAVALSGCESASTVQASPAGSALPVKVRVVETAPVADATVYLATLRSRTSAAVSPDVDGQVTRIFVKAGDRVTAGAPVVQIDAGKQQAAVSTVEKQAAAQAATVRFAAQQLERTRYLASAGVASEQELQQAQAAYDVAAASLDSLTAQVKQQREQLRYYAVTAPTAGIVGDIPVRVGDRVTSATVLTTVDQPDGLEAYIQVPVERAPQLRRGLEVALLDGDGGVSCETSVSFISPSVDTSTQTVLVKAPVRCEGDAHRTSEYVRARVIWGRTPRPLVPVLAVSRINGQPFVFVAQAQDAHAVARQVAVRLGDTFGNDYAVLDGVRAGDQLIVTGTQILVDGMPVQPQR